MLFRDYYRNASSWFSFWWQCWWWWRCDDDIMIVIIFYCSTFPVLWFIHMKLPFWILWYFSKIFRHNFQRNWWKEFEEYYNFGFSRVSAKRVRMWIESSFLNSTKSFHHNSPPNGTNSRGSVSGPKIHFKDFGTKNVPLSVGSGCCKNRFSWSDLNNCGKTTDACSLPCWLAEQRLQLWQFKICLSFRLSDSPDPSGFKICKVFKKKVKSMEVESMKVEICNGGIT